MNNDRREEEEYDYPDQRQEGEWWEYDDGGFTEWEDGIVMEFLR